VTLWQFHKLLIVTAILFAAGFAVRELVISFGDDGSAITWILAAGSGSMAVGLALYLRWLIRTKSDTLAGRRRR
jgi:hypothetical protein